MNLFEKLNRLDDSKSLRESTKMVTKKKLTESTNKVKIEVKYETYGRYGDGGDIKIGRVSGSTEVEALMKMLDHVNMYIDSDYAEEFKAENGRYPTTEEVADELYYQNGDGCDLIYWIRNLTTGKMIFDGAVEDSEPEEWDDDEIDEMLTENHKEYEVYMDSGVSDEDAFFTDIRSAKRFAKDLVKRYGKLDNNAPAIIKISNGDPLSDNWPVLYTVKYDSKNDSFKLFNSNGVEKELTESNKALGYHKATAKRVNRREQLIEKFKNVTTLEYQYITEDDDVYLKKGMTQDEIDAAFEDGIFPDKMWLNSEAVITKEGGWYQVSWGGWDDYYEAPSIEDCKKRVEEYYDFGFRWID